MKIFKTILKILWVLLLLATIAGGAGYWYFSKKYGKKERADYVLPLGRKGDILIRKDWKFIRKDIEGAANAEYDDRKWKKVNLPHTWNNKDAQNGGGDYYRGIGWYRKKLMLDTKLEGKQLFLHFGAAGTVADVYVNGQHLGQHIGMAAAFRFDATPYLKVGEENSIAVKVNNAHSDDIPPLSGDWNFYGGLHREVYLIAVDPVHIDLLDYGSPGVYLTQKQVSKESAEVAIKTTIVNDSKTNEKVIIKAKLLDATGSEVLEISEEQNIPSRQRYEFSKSLIVNNPHLWHGKKDPYLYKVRLEVSTENGSKDWVEEPLGLRSFYVDKEKGFFLNGASYPLRGVNRHGDWQNMGSAIHPADTKTDATFIEEIGANTVRVAHYQQPEYFYELLDSMGMVVWAEHSLVDDIGGSEAFKENTYNQMEELIRQNYNHPSIVMWSLANELGLRSKRDPNEYVEFLTDLNEHTKAIDSTRLTVLASHKEANHPINFITDLISFNKYFGWYHGKFEEFPAFLDEFHQIAPQFPIGISEYGAGSSIHFHSDTPQMQDHTEEWANLYHEAYIKAINERPYVWGSFVWNLFDFAVDKRDEGDQPGRNDKGLVTYDRKVKKDAFYLYKARWSEEPFVYITSRRWKNRRKPVTDVKVYSNLKEVELFLNGKSLGIKKSEDHIFIWEKIELKTLSKNEVRISALDKGHQVSDKVIWTHIKNAAVSPSPTITGIVEANKTIVNIPSNITAAHLGNVLQLPAGASFQVQSPTGQAVNSNELIQAGMKVQFTSEDEANTASYTIQKGALSIGKSLRASAELKDGQFGAEAAPAFHINDGDEKTLWSAGAITFPQWILLDLGTNYYLKELEIKWLEATKTAIAEIIPGALQYTVEISNADNTAFNNFNREYRLVSDKRNNSEVERTVDKLNETGRYIKITIYNSEAKSKVKMMNQQFPVIGMAEATLQGGLLFSDSYKVDYTNKTISGISDEIPPEEISEKIKAVEGYQIEWNKEKKEIIVSDGKWLTEIYKTN